jgi:cobalt-zinc-cadmium efflux system protein
MTNAAALLIALGTWGLLRDSVNLALDAVPPGIHPVAVEKFLASLPGVVGVHDLHIWEVARRTSH